MPSGGSVAIARESSSAIGADAALLRLMVSDASARRVSSMPGFEHVRLAVMSYKSFVPDSTFDPDPLYGLFPMREFASSTFQTLDRTERPVLLTRRSKTSRRRETYPSCALGPS